MTDIYRRLARNIQRARHQLGWTQEELGERAGLHPSFVGQIERGQKKVSLATVERLAAALKLSISQLLDEKPAARKGSLWGARIDGLLRQSTVAERAIIYNTVRELSRNIRKAR